MRVYIKGGLGNQLFQYCYLHYLNIVFQSQVGILKDSKPRPDRPFLLGDLLTSCSHIDSGSRRPSALKKLKMRISNLKFIRGMVYRRQQARLVFEAQEFSFLPEISHHHPRSIFMGYFQHWEYVEHVWGAIGPEIQRTLNLQSTAENFVGDYLVVHVRRGDLLIQNRLWGILQIDYYGKAIKIAKEKLKLPDIAICVITDQPEEAENLFSEYQNVQVFGPTDLDEWGCLSIMSRSKGVIAANSTLSWWGGYLCHKRGGFMVIPDPFFDELGERAGSAFAFPGVLKVDSEFREYEDVFTSKENLGDLC
jgi:hypothetical protein